MIGSASIAVFHTRRTATLSIWTQGRKMIPESTMEIQCLAVAVGGRDHSCRYAVNERATVIRVIFHATQRLAVSKTASRSRATSRIGGWPKRRL